MILMQKNSPLKMVLDDRPGQIASQSAAGAFYIPASDSLQTPDTDHETVTT